MSALVAHVPTEREYPNDGGFAIDCSCGHHGVLWSFKSGARLQYLGHVVEETAVAAGWDGGNYYVEFVHAD